MKRTTLILLVLVFAGWGFLSSEVRLDSYGVTIENNQPVIRWVSSSEDGLDHFELHRKTRFDSQFEEIAEIDPMGPKYAYSFRDEQVYKYAGETVEYQLFSVSTSGEKFGFEPLSVDYTPTAVRRTWGSIKAMFQ